MEESIELAFKEGSSDKVYHAELKAEGVGYVVNFAYGRRGNTLATGSKTKEPIELEKAKKVYDKLVKSKVDKGYKPEGDSSASIEVISDKVDTGIRPQLLNEIDISDLPKYIKDDRYCMQEKNDGRRKTLNYTGSTVIGGNKKGFQTPVIQQMQDDCQLIRGAAILDGEDMGEKLLVFDLLSYPNMAYKDRYAILEDILPITKSIELVKTAWTTQQKMEMYSELKEAKAEGVVFKLVDAPYTPGRPNSGGAQFKCKFYESASCIVLSQSKVKSSIAVGVLDDAGNMVEVGNVTIYPNVVTPAVDDIVEVKYLYYFPQGSLYQPVLLGVRDDVDDVECLLSKLKTKQGT
jgi:bifunctional non-homologous end joining protein LigD